MLWMAGIFTLLLIVSIGTLCYLAYSVIDEKPIVIPVKMPDMNASASVYKKLDLAGTLISAFKGHKKGTAVEKAKTVELNEKEVNAMLISALIFAEQAMPAKDGVKELRDAYFSDGAFTVMVSKKMNFKTPFGTYLNLRITFVPGIQNNHFTADVRGLRVGSLNIPVSCIKDNIDTELYKAEKSPDMQTLLKIVSELKVEKEKMTIVYNPDKLLKFMMDKGLLNGGMNVGGASLPGKE